MECRLEHANITVRSIDEAVQFLTAAFPHFRVRGGRETDHGDWKKRRLHLGTDDTYIALEEVTLEPRCIRKRGLDPGINHVGFVVKDMDALVERLQRAGYQTGDMIEEGKGPYRKRVYVLDGVGNEWEFIQYLTDDPDKANDYTV